MTFLTPPQQCPACAHPLIRDGEYLVCPNKLECPAQVTGAIKRWVDKIGVLHVGDALIDALVEAGYVTDPADLYTLDPAEISALEMAGRRVGASADKAVNNLNAKKTLPLHVIVGSLGIPMIGRTMAKTIVDAGYNTLSLMYRARINHPLVLSGGHTLPALSSVVGDKKASSFVEGFQEKVGLIAKLLCNGIQVASITGPLVGKSFCLTGFRDAALSDAIEKAGGSVKSSVSKDLSYLIALDPSSNSGKAAKARAYGVPVISPEEALQMVTA